jgi:hemoglobin
MSDEQTPRGPAPGAVPEPGRAPGREPGGVPRTDPAAAAPPGSRSFAVGAPLSQLRRPVPQVGDDRQEAEAGTSASFYEQVGGHETFVRLVHEFYTRVAEDERFRALYPEDDLGPAEERLRMFLEQYWGGPTTYSEQRGHPRLRMRHMPFPVDVWARETWLKHMRAALDTLQLSPLHDGIIWDYFDRAAHAMVNRQG